ncbi:MAG: nitronate monooxygenase [Calditerrivibrio sp.]|nr:nitronate monooxygenase [Calditerrivibrio sp.]
MNTVLTKELNIKYPIIQGGMMWISKPELVSAISNAGCLGILSGLTYETPELLFDAIKSTKEMTDKSFGVNITMLPTLRQINYDAYIDVIIDSGVKIVETAGNNPEAFMPKLKKNNVKVIHKCTSVKHALKAEKIGCDFVSIDGFECAGHPGELDVTSLILIPIAVDALKIPVVASGGFADGRGLLAALSLGACGVNMGTRFMATKEAPIHENIKNRLVEATENDTMLIERSLKNTIRVLRNRQAELVEKMEKEGKGLMELAPLLSGMNGKRCLLEGDYDGFIFGCGQAVGLVRDIPSVAELVKRIVDDGVNSFNRLKEIIG